MPDLTTMLLVDDIDREVRKWVRPTVKDWDHMNPASRKAYGLTGRAQAAEKSRRLGNPSDLHAAAASAHAAAARNTSGAARERHRLAADFHRGRASKLSKKRKRITGPDHSLTGPTPDWLSGGPQRPEDIPDIGGVSW